MVVGEHLNLYMLQRFMLNKKKKIKSWSKKQWTLNEQFAAVKWTCTSNEYDSVHQQCLKQILEKCNQLKENKIKC